MTITTRFSSASSATNATSLTVALGGTPSIGDLVVVFLGCDNQIVTHQPGYNTPNQWAQLQGLQLPNSGANNNTLTMWHHTWTAADSGSSVVFTFSPAPALGVGDKDVPNTNAVAVSVTLASPAAYIEALVQAAPALQKTVPVPATRKAAELVLTAGYCPGVTTIADNDPAGTAIAVSTNASGLGQTLYVFSSTAPAAGFKHTLSVSVDRDLMTESLTLSSALPLYTCPVLQESDSTGSRLMFRYRPLKQFTVVNNLGVFTAKRWITTDDIAAATQVFTNDAVITPTDRTNILNSGVGGEFRATA